MDRRSHRRHGELLLRHPALLRQHRCASIATTPKIILGVIYDPMQNETWTVAEGIAPTLNGQPISVQPAHRDEADAVVTVGF